jgi:vacuolar-type H+-ATPase subunit B/Vma2
MLKLFQNFKLKCLALLQYVKKAMDIFKNSEKSETSNRFQNYAKEFENRLWKKKREENLPYMLGCRPTLSLSSLSLAAQQAGLADSHITRIFQIISFMHFS